MRAKVAALTLVVLLAGCSRASAPELSPPSAFSVQPFPSAASPSPLTEVTAGRVRAVFPETWDARPLSPAAVPQEGFVAAPRVGRLETPAGAVQGKMEAFWVDVAKLSIPSDYYYLAARTAALSTLGASASCPAVRRQVLVDRPPDFTRRTFSPGDYVVTADGTCRVEGRSTRWAYVVAAPGFGPLRRTGLPTSGLYVVAAVVSGPHAERLLREMLAGARFGGTPISQIVRAAGRAV